MSERCGYEWFEPHPWIKTPGHCGRPAGHKGHHEVSTRRRTRSVVHEMAKVGAWTLCGRALPEPWKWTDEQTTCKQCLSIIGGNPE